MRTVGVLVDATAFGGAEQNTLTLLRHLDRSRWSATLIHHGEPGIAELVTQAARIGIPDLVVPPMPEGARGAARVLPFARLLRRRGFDVVHAQLTWPLATKYALAGAALARTPAVVATVHSFPDFDTTRPTAVQQRVLGHLVGCYIAVSGDLAGKLRARLRWPAERIVVIHNATEIPPRPPRPDPALRAQLAGPGGLPLVLAMARVVRDKGLDVLVDAAVMLPQARVAIAGDGPALPGLAAQVAALGVGDRVSLLGWRSDGPALLAACDVFVLPTRNEALGVSLLEAMATGRAVVATRVGGVPEAVHDGETGLIVPPDDPAALAAAIAELIADPLRRERLGAAGRERALTEFTPGRMAAAVEHVYERLLARGRRRGGDNRGGRPE